MMKPSPIILAGEKGKSRKEKVSRLRVLAEKARLYPSMIDIFFL
jgi:hypothetical protein